MQDNNSNNSFNSNNNIDEFKTPIKQKTTTTTTTTTSSTTVASNQLNTVYTTPLNNNMEEFKTPIKQNTTTTTTTSNQLKTVYTTPLKSNVYATPQSTSSQLVSSPFVHELIPYNENRKLFDLNSSDVLPMPSSTTNKNVHSPPKSVLTLGDLRNICENKLLLIESNDIHNIINSTRYKKKKVTQWFLDEWFEGNKEININIVLRTVFSVFCTLRKDNLLSSSIADQFQSFWNKLKREKRNIKYNLKKKKQDRLKDKKVVGNDDEKDVAGDDIDQHIDLSMFNI